MPASPSSVVTGMVLIAIHDVTPALEAPVRVLWRLCARLGVRPALFVVPDWHGRWPLERHPMFVEWLRGCAAEGAELFLHGERHDEVGLPRRWVDSLRATGRTAAEGEFLTLDRAAAEARIARGVVRLRALGLPPIGFVPPAWLARRGTFEAVVAQGLGVSEDAGRVHLHAPTPRRLAAPVVRWSGRSPTRARASSLVAWWRDLNHHRHPLLRIALHPQDLESEVTTRSLTRVVTHWTAARRVVTYRSLGGLPLPSS
ncbi:MAG: DUF2334 domain-containing protein [Gemmatimonadaceae bacterium]